MRIIFFGTPAYVIPILDTLNKSFSTSKERSVVAVVTQSPKPAGRHQKLERSEVDHWAFKHKIQILFDFDNLPKADIGIVAAYGKIIPEKTIKHFPYGILNIHPSLLPKYRGASPVQAAIASGESETGVTIIKMDKLLDHGPILSMFREIVLPTDTAESLRDRLFRRTAEFLPPLAEAYFNGKIPPKSQNHDEASFTRIINKEHGFINPGILNNAVSGKDTKKKWKMEFVKDYEVDINPEIIERFVRAMLPWPGAWTIVNLPNDQISDSRLSGHAVPKKARSRFDHTQRRLKILKSHIEDKKLILDEVQLEGKNVISWEEFNRGYPKAEFK